MKMNAVRLFAILFCLILLTALLPSSRALADPYPTNLQATPIDATSILVTWTDNAWAQSYRVYRNMDLVAEVSEDVNTYLDTGLTAAIPYFYRVASIVDGKEYSTVGSSSSWAIPLDAPVITSLSHSIIMDNASNALLQVELSWTSVSNATGYEAFVMEEGEGGYEQKTETVDTSVTDGHYLPQEATRYYYKVRAYNDYHLAETNEYQYMTGPFSEPVSINFVPIIKAFPGGIFIFEKKWPWGDPWAEEYLGRILEVYGEPEKWPQDVIPGTASLAGLAKKLLGGEELTDPEKQMADAIHPHGLALLLGAYATPPGIDAAKLLKQRLDDLHLILREGLPDTLTGEELKEYYGELENVFAIVSLLGSALPDSGSSQAAFRITAPDTGSLLFSSIPDSKALLEGRDKPVSTTPKPTPAPTSTPYVILRPEIIRIAPPSPTLHLPPLRRTRP